MCLFHSNQFFFYHFTIQEEKVIPGETNVNVVVEKNGKPVGSKEGIDIINKNKNNITEGGKLYLLNLVLHLSLIHI